MVGPLRRCLFPGNLGFVAKFSVHRRVEPLGDRRFSDIEPGPGMTPGNSGNPGIRFAGAERDVGVPDSWERGICRGEGDLRGMNADRRQG